MLNFEQISSKVFAAVSAIAFSAVFFAIAIAPAIPNAQMTGMIA